MPPVLPAIDNKPTPLMLKEKKAGESPQRPAKKLHRMPQTLDEMPGNRNEKLCYVHDLMQFVQCWFATENEGCHFVHKLLR